MPSKQPMIIILNGASSSGKTLTANALAKRLGPECVLTGFDEILERVQPFGPEGGLLRPLRIMSFQWTDGRLGIFKRLHREIVDHFQAGRDVIVETSLMDPRALRDAAECFAPVHAIFVGMKPPLEVSEAWEAKRGDRPAGQARKHYDLIHAHGSYDLILDPSRMFPEECAAAILDHVREHPPHAFQRILRQNAA